MGSGSAQTSGQGVDYGAQGERENATFRPARRRGAGPKDTVGQPCRYRVEAAGDVALDELPGTFPDELTPEQGLYWVRCNDQLTLRVLTTPQARQLVIDTEVQHLLDRLEVEGGTVDVRPLDNGLVAVPAYFWVDGLDSESLADSLTLPLTGTTVSVTAALTSVEWDFGDGSPTVVGDLGQAWPAHSSVSHAYRDATPTDDPYQVTATLWFQPSYAVDGVPGEALEPFAVPLTSTYSVRELQAVRTR
jgi:hypothetical protein